MRYHVTFKFHESGCTYKVHELEHRYYKVESHFENGRIISFYVHSLNEAYLQIIRMEAYKSYIDESGRYSFIFIDSSIRYSICLSDDRYILKCMDKDGVYRTICLPSIEKAFEQVLLEESVDMEVYYS